ncbi:hypothetical protein F441_01167 [Phytophthora nicotianae CJ01A1]|uniref:Uncharacterized protein n=2 Tax=Phytophthora nicotianae TaxID=4792 RepID=W2HNJ0_PHYNI|nr:hypothetical protein L915_01124 [Phytophthora nicotianae]ETM02463.1 hypothetical protein L917_01077 [Phytophthora nicotianae]ETP25998.1 hypothetical protein F441_01167 [Phytophthora nicotianae CJ01A1]
MNFENPGLERLDRSDWAKHHGNEDRENVEYPTRAKNYGSEHGGTEFCQSNVRQPRPWTLEYGRSDPADLGWQDWEGPRVEEHDKYLWKFDQDGSSFDIPRSSGSGVCVS